MNIYWLFTFNCLRPFKGYFETYEEAIAKIKELMDESEVYYLEVLKQDVEYEERENKKHEKEDDFQNVSRAKTRLSEFKGLEFEDYESSIKLIKINDFKKEDFETIFKPTIRK